MTGRAQLSEHDLNGLVQDIIDNTSSVIYVKDLSFRYLLINRQFERLFGITRSEIVGKTDYECFPVELADDFRMNDSRVVETGELVECEEVAPHDDGMHSYLTVKFPLYDPFGVMEAIAGISTDVTDRLRSQQEMESLKHRYELILKSVTDGICGLDGSGRVVFLNAAAERLLGWTVEDLRGECRSRIIISPTDAPLSPHECPVAAALRGETGPRIMDARFRCKNGGSIPVEYSASPIIESETVVGAVVTFRDASQRLASERVEQELQIAHKVQQALYPQRVPVFPGLEVAGVSVPSRLACGDYYDFLPVDDGSLFVAVGDVTGHGLGPALEMVSTRASLRAIAGVDQNPGACLERLNRVLAADLPEGMFVTLLLARFDPAGRSFVYAAAGHEAIIVRADDSVERLKSTGQVLGLIEFADFDVPAPIPLSPGDVVLFPTDGLTDTMSPRQELFGWNRAAQVVARHRGASAQSILDEVCAAADRFAEGTTRHDDVTAVVVRVL
jgi:PAS domain S-box-containing protein